MNRLMDCQCRDCGYVAEVFTSAPIGGDTVVDVCEGCGRHAALYVVLPCAPSVRTPMNSASYLDGHPDPHVAFQQKVLRAETVAARAKQQGDHVEAVKAFREVRDMNKGEKLTTSGVTNG